MMKPETNFLPGQVYLHKGSDDSALVERALAGDLTAFSTLVERYQKVVFNVALRFLQDADDAEDVAQSVFIKIYERLSSFDRRLKFFSWLYRIAVNESLNALRQRKPMERVTEQEQGPGTFDEVERADTARVIDEVIQLLTADQRAVIILRHYEALGYDEIASILNITEKKVKSRLFSARQTLRELLERRGVRGI
jgi:RNA polymerase sigma-70 factor (ECF subfamily)